MEFGAVCTILSTIRIFAAFLFCTVPVIHLHHLQVFSSELTNLLADIIPCYPCFSQCFQWFLSIFTPFSKHYIMDNVLCKK